MTEDQRDLLEEARRSLDAARVLLGNGYPGYAAARAYFAMFHVAQALLDNEAQISTNRPGTAPGRPGRLTT